MERLIVRIYIYLGLKRNLMIRGRKNVLLAVILIIIVCLINCKRCIKQDPMLLCQYIGQTSRTLREHLGEHRRGIQNNTDESVPIHFNQPKHTLKCL